MKQLEACKIQIEVEKRQVISKAWDLKYPSVQSFLTEPKGPVPHPHWEWQVRTLLGVGYCKAWNQYVFVKPPLTLGNWGNCISPHLQAAGKVHAGSVRWNDIRIMYIYRTIRIIETLRGSEECVNSIKHVIYSLNLIDYLWKLRSLEHEKSKNI